MSTYDNDENFDERHHSRMARFVRDHLHTKNYAKPTAADIPRFTEVRDTAQRFVDSIADERPLRRMLQMIVRQADRAISAASDNP